MIDERPNRGFHPILEPDQPYIFVDACMQIWPDADFANAHRHGVTAYGVTAWMPHATAESALEGIMYWHLIARRYANLNVAYTVADIRNAKANGQATLLLASQDGDFIKDKLHRIEAFYRLGLRLMLPAYNRTNQICDGCLDRTNAGLSRFGELVVAECNRVGLLLDCSHIGHRASMEIIERSEYPVVFSHSNVKSLVEHPRNIDDEQIKAVSRRNGVIGVVCWGPLLFKPDSVSRPTVDDLVEHVDYLAQMLGTTDNIGIGTDFSLGSYGSHLSDPWGEPALANVRGNYDKYVISDGPCAPQRFAAGFNAYSQVVDFTNKLHDRGYSEADVANILGENFLRVFDAVWK
ncbi:MAG: membrane dipeptidase [Caldilineaceae bacterium]|nr:membrane dipeptidase [Caldilineaceae bacterium]